MTRADVLSLLRARKAQLSARFGIQRLSIFGSAARDEARDDSDIDVLVAFDGPATSARYFGLQFSKTCSADGSTS